MNLKQTTILIFRWALVLRGIAGTVSRESQAAVRYSANNSDSAPWFAQRQQFQGVEPSLGNLIFQDEIETLVSEVACSLTSQNSLRYSGKYPLCRRSFNKSIAVVNTFALSTRCGRILRIPVACNWLQILEFLQHLNSRFTSSRAESKWQEWLCLVCPPFRVIALQTIRRFTQLKSRLFRLLH